MEKVIAAVAMNVSADTAFKVSSELESKAALNELS